MSNVQHIHLLYSCHVCEKELDKKANLLRHYLTVENYDLPKSSGRFYNRPSIKFISTAQKKSFTNFKDKYACVCCSVYENDLNTLGEHIVNKHMPRLHSALEASFNRLEEKNKWLLSTGKVVENTLYKFSKSCLVDHPSCSMILDLDDKTYLKEKLFTQEEITEMKQKNPIEFINTLPTDLANYINGFNCDSTKDLRTQLLKVQDWEHDYDPKKYHDFDWVKHTIFSFVRLYESGNLKKIQKEAWYNSHVWSLIDTIFDDIKTLQVIRGEAANAASTRRKNIDRVIGSKDIITRAFTGYKCDLIVREEKPEHEYADEYGVGETAVHNLNTKTIEEKGIKLPKVMKDMLDKLVTSNQNESKDLSVFGIQTAGLSITLLAADKPTPYITRITKIKDLSISSDVSHFTRSILPLIVLIWQFKQQILKVKNQVFSNQKRNYPKDTSEWLNACLNHDNVAVTPVTSTSTEYVNKRRKVDS